MGAVNQALGRVIRHRHDFGACVLIDARWTSKGSVRAVKYLPLWLRRLIDISENMRGESLDFPLEQIVRDLRNHFASHARVIATAARDSTGASQADGIGEDVTNMDGSEAEPAAEEGRNVRPRLSF